MLQLIRHAVKWLTPTPKPTLYFDDIILGRLEKSPEMKWWTAKLEVAGSMIEFGIAGDDSPSLPNLEHAKEIVLNYSQFELRMRVFLYNEIAKYKEEVVKQEFGQLMIASILLYWDKRPNSGMIYFHEVSPNYLWRCDYVDGKFQYLGADT